MLIFSEMKSMVEVFRNFALKLKSNGILIYNQDNGNSTKASQNLHCYKYSFGIDNFIRLYGKKFSQG